MEHKNDITILNIIIVFIVAFTLGWILHGVSVSTIKHQIEKSHIVSPEIKAKMRYHGIDVLYEDFNGNLFFYRDGKKIKVNI